MSFLSLSSAGKTTLCHDLSTYNYATFPEPIEAWENCCGLPLLKLWYSNKSDYRTILDNRIQASLFERDTTLPSDRICILERSLFSNEYIFSRSPGNSHADPIRNQLEYHTRHQLFLQLLRFYPKINLILYLDTPPEICYERVLNRSRDSENCGGLDLEYMQSLDLYHREWLLQNCYGHLPCPVVVLDGTLPRKLLLESTLNVLKRFD